MGRKHRIGVYAAAALVAVGAGALLVPAPALAHGAMMTPGSRTFLCWKDGLSPQGNIVPLNPACAAAVAQGGDTALYNWFSVLRSDGAGRTSGFIPDGQLCSGGNTTFSGFDLARSDFPVTHLTSGADFNWTYNKWAAHPGWFYLYITKDSWSPTRALAWSDLESTPFLTADHPPSVGQVATLDGYYYWSGKLPAGKTGRHIIYSVWQRSDSQETFYGCSDVVFDGGNGEVTGVNRGAGGTPITTPTPTATASATGTPTAAPTTTAPAGACSATYQATGSWAGGYQGEVIVRAGSTAINGWTVRWTNPSGQTVTQVWNGTMTSTSGASSVTVTNASWNGAVAANSTTTFGLMGTVTGTAAAPTLTCSSP